jgi:hypothetical protein
MKTGVMTGCVLCLVLGVLAQRTAQTAVVLEVQAGSCDREAVPVEADLPTELPSNMPLELIRLDTRQPVPVQLIAGSTPRLVCMIGERLRLASHAAIVWRQPYERRAPLRSRRPA